MCTKSCFLVLAPAANVGTGSSRVIPAVHFHAHELGGVLGLVAGRMRDDLDAIADLENLRRDPGRHHRGGPGAFKTPALRLAVGRAITATFLTLTAHPPVRKTGDAGEGENVAQSAVAFNLE